MVRMAMFLMVSMFVQFVSLIKRPQVNFVDCNFYMNWDHIFVVKNGIKGLSCTFAFCINCLKFRLNFKFLSKVMPR